MSPILPLQVAHYPSAILSGSLPCSSFANKLALKLLKTKENLTPDIYDTLTRAVYEHKEHAREEHPFLFYAQEHWLYHTKAFDYNKSYRYKLWRKLINGEVNTVRLP